MAADIPAPVPQTDESKHSVNTPPVNLLASRKRFRAWRLGIVLAVTVVLAACLAIVANQLVSKVWENGRRRNTTQNFQQIAWALGNFQLSNRRLPFAIQHTWESDGHFPTDDDPDAKPLYSWRFFVIPYVASYKMHLDWHEPWNSPAHERWRTVPQPYAYDGWGQGVFDERDSATVPTITRAFAITGPGTAFGDGDAEKPRSLAEIDPDTIIVVEVANSGLHWMAPGDFDVRDMPQTINDPAGLGISSRHKDGFHVVFSDGTVWYLSSRVPFTLLAKFFTIEGARSNDRQSVLGPYLIDSLAFRKPWW